MINEYFAGKLAHKANLLPINWLQAIVMPKPFFITTIIYGTIFMLQ